jgi:hypothetical protein
MSYLNIKEATKYIKKSDSTIRNYLRALKHSGVKQYQGKDILTYKTLKNNSKQIFILKSYLDSLVNSDKSINTHFDRQIDTQLTPDSTSLIEALKDHITTLKEELENKNKQINEFLVLEQKAIDRIQEQNHIIHQLNTIIKDKESPKFIEAEDLTEQADNLSKHRQDVLKSEMNKNQDIYDWLEQNSYNRTKD